MKVRPAAGAVAAALWMQEDAWLFGCLFPGCLGGVIPEVGDVAEEMALAVLYDRVAQMYAHAPIEHRDILAGITIDGQPSQQDEPAPVEHVTPQFQKPCAESR